MAVPVLAGSASYALSEALSWQEGLNLKFKKAHGFYGVIIIATLIGLLINFIGIDPIKALVFTAVFNGIAAVPLIFVIAKIAGNEKIMGENKSGLLSKSLVWITFIAMLFSALAILITFFYH
jgi:Mn2+/Fe2+ NRAMP family transporter